MIRLLRLVLAFVLVALALRLLTQLGDDVEPAMRDVGTVADDSAAAVDVADAERAGAATPAVAASGPSAEQTPSARTAPELDLARIAYTLDARGPATYLPELLDAREGWSFRWPDRSLDPLRIWVQEPTDGGFDASWVGAVHDAFSVWGNLALPFVMTFTRDSSRAEVHVTWVERFDGRMTGRTLWQHDQHGWILGGNIQLARQLPDGRPVDAAGVRAIARHEVGHLLGLDHTRDDSSIMAPQVFVTEISEADRRTIRLVYDLPPGLIRP